MDKKTSSATVTKIIEKVANFPEFSVLVFGQKCILETAPEEWPVVDCILAWHSTGFPLDKCEQYVTLRKPYQINTVSSQRLLMNRRLVYERCKEFDIPMARHVMVLRGEDIAPGAAELSFEEGDDEIVVGGVELAKPFVEKPLDADDHNIWIYYPRSAGGGCQKLFRKVANKSSAFDRNQNTVRREGSFIYEEFLPTQGVDLKGYRQPHRTATPAPLLTPPPPSRYTLGLDYCHVEARKSPVLDGIVERDAAGMEVRYPVVLSQAEKLIAAKVVLAFGQNVCGFDILRTTERSYVCDVNGLSLVKKSKKYVDDAAHILREFIK